MRYSNELFTVALNHINEHSKHKYGVLRFNGYYHIVRYSDGDNGAYNMLKGGLSRSQCYETLNALSDYLYYEA